MIHVVPCDERKFPNTSHPIFGLQLVEEENQKGKKKTWNFIDITKLKNELQNCTEKLETKYKFQEK